MSDQPELPDMGEFTFTGGPMDGTTMRVSGFVPIRISVLGGEYVGRVGHREYVFQEAERD